MEKFEEELEKVSAKINSMSLSEEFKENLCKKLDYEYSRMPPKRRFFIPKQIVAVFACCILVTSYAFADGIENAVNSIFSNTSREIQQAVESGNLQTITMDYVKKEDVSIKIDYTVVSEDFICLAFNVLSEEEFSNVYVDNIEFMNKYNERIYSTNDIDIQDIKNTYTDKKLNNKNSIYIIKVDNLKLNDNEIKIILNGLEIGNNKVVKKVNETWEYNININN